MIKCVLNLRDGQFGRTLRCRKGLNPKDHIFIVATDTLQSVLDKVKAQLPGDFIWDPSKENLRYQRNREQPQTTLEVVDNDFYFVFNEIQNRQKRRLGDDCSVSLWVFGEWTYGYVPPVLGKRLLEETQSNGESRRDSLVFETRRSSYVEARKDSGIDFKQFENPDFPARRSPTEGLSVNDLINSDFGAILKAVDVLEPAGRIPPIKILPNEMRRFSTNSFGDKLKRSRITEFASLNVMMNGVVMPLEVEIASLKKALGLPL